MTTTAGLLPNGKQQFIDIDGKPLVGGMVYFFTPGTTHPKTTWQDPSQTIPNTDPVILDSRGQALIYGNGQYRQVVRDMLGNTIWDALTEWDEVILPTESDTLIIVSAEGLLTDAEQLPPACTGVTRTYPVNLTNATGYAVTAPTADATFTFKLYPGATSVATATFAAGQNVPTFTCLTSWSLSPGQALVPFGPTTADATMADVTIAFQEG